MEPPPSIISFVIRFILEEPSDEQIPPLRRIIVRHIQTDQEISCSSWTDVVAFVQQFVQLENNAEA
ncbi:MAG TPA: hypothetical protein VF355_06195 [Anaerolineaceae bacterium]